MIDDDGIQPILMDLGSLAPSPTPITSRSMALALQDEAAEHSTMPYRAPELFDVKTGTVVDTKVDIWSLGEQVNIHSHSRGNDRQAGNGSAWSIWHWHFKRTGLV